jgi:hypothetical protein
MSEEPFILLVPQNAEPAHFPRSAPATRLISHKTESPLVDIFAGLTDPFWDALLKAPYGLTIDSTVCDGGALAALLEALSCDPRAARNANFTVQYASDVLFIRSEGFEVTTAAELGDVVAWKRTVGRHRILLLENMLESAARSEASASIPAPAAGAALSSSASDKSSQALTATGLPASLAAFVSSIPERGGGEGLRVQLFLLDRLLSWLRTTAKGAASSTTGALWSLRYVAASTAFELRHAATQDPPELFVSLSAISRVFMQSAAPQPSSTSTGGAAASRGRPDASERAQSQPAPSQTIPLQTTGKRPRERESGADTSAPHLQVGVSLAIIVPFREQKEQNRGEQLRRFAEAMPAYLTSAPHKVAAFHIIIVEQSNDGYKFNRAKLLNVGFMIAIDPDRKRKFGLAHRFDAFCFHDVDLLPSHPSLLQFYTMSPEPRPVHIAAVWQRYPYDNYVGGILTLSERQMMVTNGCVRARGCKVCGCRVATPCALLCSFPNNFWGWGGEDDEMYRRLRAADLLPLVRPPSHLAGSLTDMEDVLLAERGQYRCSAQVLKPRRMQPMLSNSQSAAVIQ